MFQPILMLNPSPGPVPTCLRWINGDGVVIFHRVLLFFAVVVASDSGAGRIVAHACSGAASVEPVRSSDYGMGSARDCPDYGTRIQQLHFSCATATLQGTPASIHTGEKSAMVVTMRGEVHYCRVL